MPNKATREVKAWALALLDDPEWRESARNRMIAGKAPHLEAHLIASVIPKKDAMDVSGKLEITWEQ